MPKQDILPANFTISESGLIALKQLRKEAEPHYPDGTGVISIGWGLVYNNHNIKMYEHVLVTFYDNSQYKDIKDLIQTVSGIEIVFFITKEYYSKFEGKVLDYAPDKGFILK